MKVSTITIVGGGTSAWLTAAYLSHNQPHIKITVVDKEVGTPIGVGEATLLSFRPFLEESGMPIEEWFMPMDCAYKSGILFTNWQTPGEDIWHPFYKGDRDVTDDWGVWDFWSNHQDLDFKKYALAFYDNSIYHNSVHLDEISKYAVHVDCGKVVRYIKNHLQNKITFINSDVIDVDYEKNVGVKTITLKDGKKISSDLFIDCTGFKNILRKPDNRVDLQNRLFVNTAVAGHVQYQDRPNELTPYVKCDAVDHGWVWKIPVQSRIGSGMLFNRNITDVETAKKYFTNYWNQRINEKDLKVINWDPFYNEDQWKDNVVNVGLSAGFIEPLESTGIALMTYAIGQINGILNEGYFDKNHVDYFNIQMKILFENCVDFVSMHYANNTRQTEFWQHVRDKFKPSKVMLSYLEDLENPNITIPITSKYNHMFCGPNWSIFLQQLGYPIAKRNIGIPQEESMEYLVKNYIEYEKYRHLQGRHHSTELDRLKEIKKHGIN